MAHVDYGSTQLAHQPVYPRNSASTGGAIASILLGVFSLIGCYFTPAAAVTGLVGIGMGVWGLYSARRSLAIIGLMICCVVLAVASFNGAVDLYEQIYKESPWSSPVEDLDKMPTELE